MKSQSQAFAWMRPGRCPPAAIIAHNAAHIAMAERLAAPDPLAAPAGARGSVDELADRADHLEDVGAMRARLDARPAPGFGHACARLKSIERTLAEPLIN